MSQFEAFLGEAVGSAAGFAAGYAVGPVLRPVLRLLESETWQQYPDQPVAVLLAAQAVAEGKTLPLDPATEAAKNGYGPKAFDSLVAVLKQSPAIAAAQDLRRRGVIDDAGFTVALERAGLEQRWVTAYNARDAQGLRSWEHEVPPADLALGLIRGNLDPATVGVAHPFPTGLSTNGSNVPADPYIGIDVMKEAAASGIDPERMALLARNVGLPPGVIEGLNMLNRGIINEAAFGLLIEQSDARLSWGPFLLQLRRMLLTTRETVEARLRGYIHTDAEMYQRTAMHGLNQEDTTLLFDITGRPLTTRQIVTAIERGGTFGGEYAGVPEPYLTALRQSNIRPEWGNLAWSNRYSYPGAFVLRTLAQAGELGSAADVDLILRQIGWPPELATKVANVWVPGGASTTAPDPHLKSQITTTITAIRKAYLAGKMDATAAHGYIDAAESATTLTGVWDVLKAVEGLPAAPFTPASPALIAAVEAEGYTVTPPPPQPPANVLQLEALGYTVTPASGAPTGI